VTRPIPPHIKWSTRVDKTDGCWLWTGRLTPDGYGIFDVKTTTVRAHRFAYELHVGPIPPGLEIDHLCRVRHCVNPDHLEAVTPQVNTLRSDSIQGINGRKTQCIRGHMFSPENTYVIPTSGSRNCLSCKREWEQANRDRRNARRRERRRLSKEEHRGKVHS
jgi:hypothetical protein